MGLRTSESGAQSFYIRLYGFRVWGVGLAGGSRIQGFGFRA